MRTINRIVLHCTATQQSATVKSILNYWKNVKKWRNPGYHYLIEPNGEVHELLPIERVSNGAREHNHDSIHIGYIGGVDFENNPIDNRTPYQKKSQIALIASLRLKFIALPVIGHRDLPGVNKACPCFDVKEWLKSIYDKKLHTKSTVRQAHNFAP